MGVLHFLNVLDGDCTIIRHTSGRVSVIDVNNASIPEKNVVAALSRELLTESIAERILENLDEARGNFHQKKHPVNPIEYMKERGIDSVFRFILTHADMDHMGGIKCFFEKFGPPNFWDTDNKEEKEFDGCTKYDEADWEFYKSLRDGSYAGTKRLVKYDGQRGTYWNQDPADSPDGLHILAPNQAISQLASEAGDCNSGSYVFLYRNAGFRIVLAGDSHDESWDFILDTYKEDVTDIDLLLAPHHGRDSDRSYDFLDVLNPKMTFFGNALSKHLAYGEWSRRGLPVITNNQANCMIVQPAGDDLDVYVTNENFARKCNPYTFFSDLLKGWFYGTIAKKVVAVV